MSGPCPALLAEPPAGDLELNSGNCLLYASASTGIQIRMKGDNQLPKFANGQPLCLKLLDSHGATRWLEGSYSSVVRDGTALRCAGTLATPGGSQFQFNDRYEGGSVEGTYLLSRGVTVRNSAADDRGFLTRLSVSAAPALELSAQEVFIPGVWYRDQQHLPPYAMNADPAAEHYVMREDRLPLPLVMMREPHTGATLTLLHAAPDGSTCAADRGAGPVVDARIQTASVGIFGRHQAALGLYFPCAEGDHSDAAKGGRDAAGKLPERWAERFHPVRPGVRHAYQVLLELSVQPDFPTALREAWRVGYQTDYPSAQRPATDLPAIYDASMQLLSQEFASGHGAAGVPFRLKLPAGELLSPNDLNFQMGFVGQQLPLAYHLLREGLRHDDQEALRDGAAIVDFWAANSLTPEGLPRIWYNLHPKPQWRRHNTFLRMACDGMSGALDAWDVMKAHGTDRAEWLTFCQRFGDWLVAHQSTAGTWAREYDLTGAPVNESPLNTADAVPFLAKLSVATGQPTYRAAALKAGEWIYHHVHEAYAYAGGTADNPNVTDKEAGYLALIAFLALHDLEGSPRWLAAARQAADFTETWTYAWSLPVNGEAASPAYPRGCPATAFSLIAAGHSGADLFLAGAAFSYYRLYLATGEAHYAAVARQFLYDTKLAVDQGGSLGYGLPGLCTEALTLTPPRGHGVEMWLPWLTYSMIEPLAQFEDAFGRMDLPAAALSLTELREKDAAFAASLGLQSAGASAGAPASKGHAPMSR